MKIITTRKGERVKVCDCHFELVEGLTWHISDKGYARRTVNLGGGRKNAKYKTIQMHRLILGAEVGEVLDHINGDTLDNRCTNLRKCTMQQNTWNQKRRLTNRTGYKGVVKKDKNRYRKWGAEIRLHGRTKYLGGFLTPEEAAKAYNDAALKHFGEYARLNQL